MNEVTYELCEKCNQTMEAAGVVGLTTEEMKAQQAEFDFGLALSFLKEGEKVARKSWNDKGVYIYLVRGSLIAGDKLRNEAAEHIGASALSHIQINAHIDMKAADGSIAIGWLASQTDMLAEDWILI